MSAPYSCIGDLWCPAQLKEWYEKTSYTCFRTVACEPLEGTASVGWTAKATFGLRDCRDKNLINTLRLLSKGGACAHLFKLEVTWQTGCVQQLLDWGNLSDLFFFQKDLESIGTLRSFPSWSKNRQNLKNYTLCSPAGQYSEQFVAQGPTWVWAVAPCKAPSERRLRWTLLGLQWRKVLKHVVKNKLSIKNKFRSMKYFNSRLQYVMLQ